MKDRLRIWFDLKSAKSLTVLLFFLERLFPRGFLLQALVTYCVDFILGGLIFKP
jgi:hypothetical protein